MSQDGDSIESQEGASTHEVQNGNSIDVEEEGSAPEVHMAMNLSLPPPESLDLSGGNVAANWKKFKQKWMNYEIATGINSKESATRVAALLPIIGNDAINVFNTFTWDDEGDDKKIDKVLLQDRKIWNGRTNDFSESCSWIFSLLCNIRKENNIYFIHSFIHN